LNINNVERDIENLLYKCGLTINQLKKIGHLFKKTMNTQDSLAQQIALKIQMH
jgi:hypothetical protein